MQRSLDRESQKTAPDFDEATVNSMSRRLARLDKLIDEVGQQRYCSRSRLFWHTDLEAAKAAAEASGKPILSLRMLGKLNEDLSCANSRFFRTTLYANAEVSKLLREQFVLHWQSVRPVPKVTIDFGDGRKLERTITGNSAHHVLTADGTVIDVLPGLYGPKAFQARLQEALEIAQQLVELEPQPRREALAAWHASQLRKLGEQYQRDLTAVGRIALNVAIPVTQEQAARAAPPRADAAANVARPKRMLEAPLIAAALPGVTNPDNLNDEAVWERIAALHAEEAKLDDSSRALIRSENPAAAVAGALSITKRRAEDPLLKLVASLESSIALDTVKNEYRLHRQIHQWLSDGNYQPAVDELNERVYAELFLTPSSDPWLGLAPADVYTAIPNGGVVRK
jgi:hypothetical protein